MVKSRIILAALTFFLGAVVPVQAQIDRASIRGSITDAADMPYSGVAVTVIHENTNDTRIVSTDERGEYIASHLLPGAYRLEVKQGGFKKHIQQFLLRVNQELRVDVALEVGNLTQQVVVVSPSPMVKKDSTSLGTIIDGRQIAGLPLDGRNFLELSLLAPGVVPAAPGSAGSVRGEFAFNANGGREDANNFLLDGAYNVDPKLNTFGIKPPVDAIQEFEIQTSGYDASFGRNAGAQVNVITKSGSNQFHGTAYEFFRNRVLDARNFFSPSEEPDPQYQRNQFGFSLGGPIVKNRTFLFADYEGTRTRQGITRVANVPTLRERNGDFSRSLFKRPLDPFTQQPFIDGQIPQNRISPIGLAIAALYPLPNRSVPFQNYVSSPALRDRSDHFDARIDQSIGDSSTWTIRYSFVDRDLFEPFSGPTFATVPGFGTNIPRRSQNLLISETELLSPKLVNEVRLSYGRVSASAFHENLGNSINQSVGLPELSQRPRDFGLSFVTVTGFSPLGDEFNNPQHSATNTFQVLDTASLSHGRHLLKFGIDLRTVQQNAFRDVQSRGFLTFSDQVPITGNALADLLIGFPALTGGAQLDNPQHLRTESYNFFIHDSFRITPHLTLSAGLRFEYNSPPVDVRDRANVFDPDTRSLVQVGTEGIPRSGFRSDTNNWAPRLGLAWGFGSRGNTVLHASYGIYYDQSALAPGEGLYFNDPFFKFSLFFPLPGLPLTLQDPFPNFFPVPIPNSALGFQRDLSTPYVQHWSLSVQQQLGRNRVLEITYAGSKGSKLLTARDINQPQPSPRLPNPRPIPQFDDINLIESRAASSYHSLQVRFQQRHDFGLSLLSSYTWSKSLDNASNFFSSSGDPNFPQDSFNVGAEKGRSNFDVRHRLSVSFSYDIPVGGGHGSFANQGWKSNLFSGWKTLGIISLQSGRPFTVALLPEIDNSHTGRSILGFGANDRPNVVADPRLSKRTPSQWFDPNAFRFPPPGSFGNSGRNTVDGPGFANANISLLKDTPLSETLKLQFRVEFFNLLNRANFDLPDNFFGSPTFGRLLSAQAPRHIQFGLKFIF